MTNNIVLLIKKNITKEIRSWKIFLFEAVIALFLIISLDPTKFSFEEMEDRQIYNTEFHYDVGDLESLKFFREFAKSGTKKYKILYTPDSKPTREIIEAASITLGLERPELYSPDDDILNIFDEEHHFAAVSFDLLTKEKLDIGIHFPSQLRSITVDNCPTILNCTWLTRCPGGHRYNSTISEAVFDIYSAEGFLPLQHQIFKEWIKFYNKSNYDLIPTMSVNSFVLPLDSPQCYERIFYNFVWLFYHFIFFIPFLGFLWRICSELEEDIPRRYSLYGFSRNEHWIAHLLTGCFHLFVLEFMIWKMIVYEVSWKPAGINICFVLFFVFYNIILMLNVFVLATLVQTARMCVLVGASLWLISYCIFADIINVTDLDLRIMGILLIFTNHFMAFGMGFFSNPFVERIWIMLVFQIIVILVYGIALKYVERIRWGKWIENEYITKRCRMNSIVSNGNSNNMQSESFKWSYFEYGPIEGHLLVLENIWVYQNDRLDKAILKNISLKFFKNEISVLVGPCNSGKTTLIETLAGWRRYQGQIYFDGSKEVSDNWICYSGHIDISMVENALIYPFTVEEQLTYVILIKTPDSNESERHFELDKWLLLLRPFITEPDNDLKKLNYDQKRLLSLCCLLCGKRNNRIILLDEPTRNMTFEAQKAYWHILKQEKLNRLIIVTTDSIEEADQIGDRIGILYSGSLMAWGTSFYLRSNVCKEVYAVMFTNSTASAAAISNILEKYIADITMHNEFKDRIIYRIPCNKKPIYQKMLIDLEKEFENLGIEKVYVTSGELYDVYGKLTSEKRNKNLADYQTKSLPVYRFPKTLTPYAHSQISALFYKKLLYQAPHYVPVAIIMLAIFLIMPFVAFLIRNIAKRPGILFKSDAAEALKALALKTPINDEVLFGLSFLGIMDIRVMNYYGVVCGVLENGGENSAIWINELVLHSAGITLNMAHNVLLQDLYPNNTNVDITVRNEPILIPTEDKTSLMQISHLKLLLTMGIIMPLTMSSFILALIDERRHNIYLLQRIAGVTRMYFWLTHIVWDYMVYWVIVLLYILTLSAYTIHEFSIWSILASLLLLGFYGITFLLLVYVVFLKSEDHKWRAFFKIFISQIVLGIAAYLFYRKVATDNAYLYYILIFSPTFALIAGMANVSVQNSVHAYCQLRCQSTKGCSAENACSLIKNCCYGLYFQWSFPGILEPILFMLLTAIILTFIFFGIVYYQDLKKYFTNSSIKPLASVCYPYDTQRVIDEKVRISNLEITGCKEYAVLADQVEYEIPSKEIRIKSTSFALEYSTCMGVYGPAASGKSHLIKQLIGASPIRFGEVYICGYKCKIQLKWALRKVGYSPEEYGYIEGATIRQLLTLFLRLNGTPSSECYGQLQDISQRLNLRQYINTRISELPSHIKRRINIAIALVARKKVLIFDEPFRGMPFTEISYIRSVVRQARRQGNAVILVSQDSRELEELTDFIIMVDHGEMLATGSVHSVRQLYTIGLYLEIKLYTDGSTLVDIESNLDKDIENLLRFITFLQNDSELIMRRGIVLKFYLPIETVMYSFLFGTLEKNRERLNIKEYIISQGTLATAYDNLHKARKQKIRYGHNS